jgi:cell division protein FtsA
MTGKTLSKKRNAYKRSGKKMAKKTERDLLVGLDIGTSKVAAIVGEFNSSDEMEVIGIGVAPSKGLKKGVVVNLESTVNSIQRAVEEAELMAGCQIKKVFAGIAGSHIRSLNSHGIVAIKDKEVMQTDIDRVIDSARAVAIPADQKILHILPQEFVIDQQEGIKEPVGMSGIRLEAKVHMVTGSVSAAQNIIKCIRRCGLEVEDIVLEQLASCTSVLSEDEKDLGVCLIDIGGGTTDIAVFSDGAIKHTAVIPIAGDQVTNDIAVALRTPTKNAEEIKIKHACALTQLADPQEMIDVPSIGDRDPRKISAQNLAEIIEPRYEELMLLVQAELRRSGYEDLIAAGLVLTGGSSKVKGLTELAEEIFHMPVRIGFPYQMSGLTDVVKNPVFSTGVGLLMYGREHQGKTESLRDENQSIWARMKNWFQGNF